MNRFYPNVALIPWSLVEDAEAGRIDAQAFQREALRFARLLASHGRPPQGATPPAPAATAPAAVTTASASASATAGVPAPAADGGLPDDFVAWFNAEVETRFPESALAADGQASDLWHASGRNRELIEDALLCAEDYARRKKQSVRRITGFLLMMFRQRTAEDIRLEAEAIRRRRRAKGETLKDSVSRAALDMARQVEEELNRELASLIGGEG